jgi:hypothetical protein
MASREQKSKTSWESTLVRQNGKGKKATPANMFLRALFKLETTATFITVSFRPIILTSSSFDSSETA